MNADRLIGLAYVCERWHGGQWSRGYRLMCRLNPSNFSSAICEELRETEVYQYLVSRYANAV